MRRYAALFAVLLAACSASAPAPSPALVPGGLGGIAAGTTTWAYAGTLLLPLDPNSYSNVVLDAKPLSDGGWIVLRGVAPRRGICDPLSYGCFIRRTTGQLLKLDASGTVVAQEHGAEPFGLLHVTVFESAGVVVGEGQQVRNGTLHAFHLDALDGIASELTTCVAVGPSCFSYRVDYQTGRTPLEERDPKDLHVTRTYPQIAMDGLYSAPAIFPASNLLAWRPTTESAPFIHVAALDASRSIAIPWLARLEAACDVWRVGDDRAFVLFGPPACRGDTGWHWELVEVSSGRAVRVFGPDDTFSGNTRDAAVLAATGVVVDPRDGTDGPTLPGGPLTIDWVRGVAVVALPDGGAAVFRRQTTPSAARNLSFRTVGSSTCADLDFPRLMRAIAGAIACPALAALAGPSRLLVATGRAAYSPSAFTVERVVVDPATHIIDVLYTGQERRTTITDPSPAAVIELSDPPAGEWLVRLGSQDADRYGWRGFVVRFP